jgi:hypothetical protein
VQHGAMHPVKIPAENHFCKPPTRPRGNPSTPPERNAQFSLFLEVFDQSVVVDGVGICQDIVDLVEVMPFNADQHT